MPASPGTKSPGSPQSLVSVFVLDIFRSFHAGNTSRESDWAYPCEANDSLTKEVCRKVGVPYVSKAEENLATAESKNL